MPPEETPNIAEQFEGFDPATVTRGDAEGQVGEREGQSGGRVVAALLGDAREIREVDEADRGRLPVSGARYP